MKPNFSDYPLTISGPTDAKTFESTGEWIACYRSSEAFDISINGEAPIEFAQGLFLRWTASQGVRFRITPRAGASVFPNSIVLRIGTGDFRDFRFNVVGSITVAPGTIIRQQVAARLTSPGDDIVLLAGVNTPIMAASADVEAVDVYNDNASTIVRVATDPAELSDSRGLLVRPKSSRTVRVNGGLHARAVGGIAVVSVNFTSFV